MEKESVAFFGVRERKTKREQEQGSEYKDNSNMEKGGRDFCATTEKEGALNSRFGWRRERGTMAGNIFVHCKAGSAPAYAGMRAVKEEGYPPGMLPWAPRQRCRC